MTTNRDRLEPAQSDLGIPTARATDRVFDGEQNAERNLDRGVQRDVQRNADQAGGDRTALFEQSILSEFNTRWTDIQTGFVDEPRRAVQQADALVSDVIQRITDSFGSERAQLEQQWDRGDNVSTEDLRQALQRYRSFFSSLLTL
jgi:hypothetical protein